jgi:hypothetical protein
MREDLATLTLHWQIEVMENIAITAYSLLESVRARDLSASMRTTCMTVTDGRWCRPEAFAGRHRYSCALAANVRFGEPYETWWMEAEHFSEHDTATCEATNPICPRCGSSDVGDAPRTIFEPPALCCECGHTWKRHRATKSLSARHISGGRKNLWLATYV